VVKNSLKRCLESLERAAADQSSEPLPYSPIFIIGPPRSGSTLLSQVLIERFQLGYFSNLHRTFSSNPSLIERLLRVSRWRRHPNFESIHGKTAGWTGHSECPEYWYRFFPRHPQCVSEQDVDPQKMGELRGSMRALGKAFNRPILIKNLPCALRLAALQRALPEALYLVMQRDWVEMGRSILLARRRIHGTYDKWVSLEPPGFEELSSRPAHEQVVEQIRQTYKLIEEARVGYGGDRFLDVNYELFCGCVPAVLAAISDFTASQGVHLLPRRAVPDHFARSQGGQIESELLIQLESYVRDSGQSLSVINHGSQ
jgi:Sulfotransferase family